jgi:ABC-type bacteriocin/lantibiotic exporter with double-glycine peptidase domain
LSGGQLQRLGIARALFSQPSLIVLDEPTSAMDPITERIVLDRILARESCTKVVVAHRLATISKADLVIVLNQGRIEVVDTYEVVQKTHSLLLKGIQNQ